MAKQISNIRVILEVEPGVPATIDHVYVWYEVTDDTDESFRKRESFRFETDHAVAAPALLTAALNEVESREGIV